MGRPEYKTGLKIEEPDLDNTFERRRHKRERVLNSRKLRSEGAGVKKAKDCRRKRCSLTKAFQLDLPTIEVTKTHLPKEERAKVPKFSADERSLPKNKYLLRWQDNVEKTFVPNKIETKKLAKKKSLAASKREIERQNRTQGPDIAVEHRQSDMSVVDIQPGNRTNLFRRLQSQGHETLRSGFDVSNSVAGTSESRLEPIVVPPKCLPEYFEYQRRKKEKKRRFDWILKFHGKWTRRTSDDVQSEIISVL